MKQSAWPFALLAAAAVAFSSCVASRQVSFNEADFARTTGTGSGSVTGHASVTFSWQDWTGPQTTTRTADSETVVLLPVNAYTTESIQRKYIAGVNLADGDPRYVKYIRSTSTDDQGNFAFHQIPPGEYYVGSVVNWNSHYWSTDSEGILQKYTLRQNMLICARVSVSNGQTTSVTHWIQGKRKNTDDVI